MDSEALEVAETDEERLECVVGIGMVYKMQLSSRLFEYKRKNKLMKDRKYKMIEIMSFTDNTVLSIGFNKGDTSFIFEYALHDFVEQFNEKFFTRPGLPGCSGAIFVNYHAVDTIKQKFWIKQYAYERLITVLELKEYVVEEVSF